VNRTTIAIGLALIGTVAWMAVFAGLIPERIGWFIATVFYLLSGTAWWIPFGRTKGDRKDEG